MTPSPDLIHELREYRLLLPERIDEIGRAHV